MTFCIEHLQVKINGINDILCDLQCYTAISMMRYFFLILFLFGREWLQGQRVALKGQGDE